MLTLWQSVTNLHAKTELSKTLDCTETELKASIDQEASPEENLERLSQQFFQSLNKIDHCDRNISEKNEDQPKTDSPDANTGKDATQSLVQEENLISDGQQSSASSSLVGTDHSKILNSTPENGNAIKQTEQHTDTGVKPATGLTNGKIPDDIPDVNNDSVFEAQIREAAIAERDPIIQNKLWNEYRRYKGLPEKK